MKRLLAILRNLNIPVLAINRSTDPQLTDDEIQLDGEFKGIQVQIGRGYYAVVREVSDGCVFFDGNGDLWKEINEAKNFKQ